VTCTTHVLGLLRVNAISVLALRTRSRVGKSKLAVLFLVPPKEMAHLLVSTVEYSLTGGTTRHSISKAGQEAGSMVVRRLHGVAHLSKSHGPIRVVVTTAADIASSSATASNVRMDRTINTAERTVVTAMTASPCLTTTKDANLDDGRGCRCGV
jgi:hypothetical protein